jgi:CubicO group peptidase (beta-lactamase class C family)
MIRTSRRACLALAATPALLAARPARAQGREAVSEASVAAMLALSDTPGASFAHVSSDGRVTAGAAGYAKAGEVKATSETLFEAASLSKPVFAVAVLELARQGRIDLDRPIQADLPFTDDALARRITPRHVLSQSTGLPNWREAAAPLASRFEPGSAFGYSGEGYFLLQRLVEALSGRTAAQVARTLVLDPAGMGASRYGWGAGEHPAAAFAHDDDSKIIADQGPAGFEARRDAGPARPVETWSQVDREAAVKAQGKPAAPMFMTPNMAAGLWTTAGDYGRFLVFARRYPEMARRVTPVKATLSWGLGWGLEERDGRRFAWHWGSNAGVRNLFAVDLATGEGFVTLTNGENGPKVYQRAARQALAHEFDAFLWL